MLQAVAQHKREVEVLRPRALPVAVAFLPKGDISGGGLIEICTSLPPLKLHMAFGVQISRPQSSSRDGDEVN